MKFTKPKAKKAMEMTLPIIVAIVIGLVIIVIMVYMLMGKSKALGQGTSCIPDDCSANPNVRSDCSGKGGGYVPSYTPCTYEKTPGRCCMPESP
jgi:hypothetical protein